MLQYEEFVSYFKKYNLRKNLAHNKSGQPKHLSTLIVAAVAQFLKRWNPLLIMIIVLSIFANLFSLLFLYSTHTTIHLDYNSILNHVTQIPHM